MTETLTTTRRQDPPCLVHGPDDDECRGSRCPRPTRPHHLTKLMLERIGEGRPA